MDNEKLLALAKSAVAAREALACATIERKRAAAAEDEARSRAKKAERDYFNHCAAIVGMTSEYSDE